MNHTITFVVKNRTLKKEYRFEDFKIAEKLYLCKLKNFPKGKWQFIAKVV